MYRVPDPLEVPEPLEVPDRLDDPAEVPDPDPADEPEEPALESVASRRGAAVVGGAGREEISERLRRLRAVWSSAPALARAEALRAGVADGDPLGLWVPPPAEGALRA